MREYPGHPAAAAAGGDCSGAGPGSAPLQPHPPGSDHNNDASDHRPDQTWRLEDGNLLCQLLPMVEGIGAVDAPVPAFQKHASDLYPLMASSSVLFSSSALLKLAIKQNVGLGTSCLHTAVRKSNSTRFMALIDAGADVNSQHLPESEPTPERVRMGARFDLLELAVMLGRVTMIPFIVAVPHFDLKNSINAFTNTVLQRRFSHVVRLLADDSLASINVILAQPRVADDIHLFEPRDLGRLAAALGNVDMLARLFRAVVSNSSVQIRDAWGWAVLSTAEHFRQIPVLQWLHDQSQLDNDESDWARSLLSHTELGSLAVQVWLFDVLDWLASHGYLGDAVHAQPNADAQADEGVGSPLPDLTRADYLWRAAGRSGNMTVVNYLRGHFEMGQNWNLRVLDEAVYSGCVSLLRRLLDAGCPVHQTSLHRAVRCYRSDLVASILDHLETAAVDLTDAKLCSMSARRRNLDILKLLRAHGAPWSSDLIVEAIRVRERLAAALYEDPELSEFLQWALDNGVPLGNDADPHAALRFACSYGCCVSIRAIIDCYGTRAQHLDLKLVTDVLLIGHFEGGGSAITSTLQWLHDAKGFRFTHEHMRAAVKWRRPIVIAKLHELGCPWDASMIPSLIMHAAISGRNLRLNLEELVELGCPMDITACEYANFLPAIGWAREILNGTDCPCGHALHQ